MLLALKAVAIPFLVALGVALGGASMAAQAAPPDLTSSPAGPVTGVITIFSPPGTALPGILTVAPTPVGSLVVPLRLPTVSGTGPALTQLQVLIPGPNPAQNTPLALAQLLDMVLRSAQAGPAGTAAPLVTVYTTPSH